ncbi:MAG: hypothetical protein ACK8QZ_11780, partial [Anaerolineales bacterium]
MLLRRHGFTIFTDHRNLTYLFHPERTPGNLRRATLDRVGRWAVGLRAYDFTIQHQILNGASNLWADLLSRWGAPKCDAMLAAHDRDADGLSHDRIRDAPTVSVNVVRRTPLDWRLASPSQQHFAWPDLKEIREAQCRVTTGSGDINEKAGGYKRDPIALPAGFEYDHGRDLVLDGGAPG